MDTAAIKTMGVHHVGLTVKDLGKTNQFFTGVLGYQKFGEKPDYPESKHLKT